MLQNEEAFFLLNLFDQHRQKRLWLKLQHGGPFQTLLQYVVELCQHDPWVSSSLSFLTKSPEAANKGYDDFVQVNCLTKPTLSSTNKDESQILVLPVPLTL